MGLEKPYIIAEVGSNWKTLNDCFEQIKRAKSTGADAAKFQYFNHHDLYGTPGEMLSSLPMPWIERLANCCKDRGIDFMCSVFSPVGVKVVNPYVNMHKIASCENQHRDLIEAAYHTGKRILVSLGCEKLDEFCRPKQSIIPMECVAAYPAESSDYSFKYLSAYLGPKGLSDHTMTDLTAILAVGAGFSIFEKHFNGIDKLDGTDDAEHSLSQSQFTKYVNKIRLAYQIMSQNKDIRESELDIKRYYKRRQTPYGFYRTKP